MPAIVWKGSISFGLVSFPVRLHSAARAETVRFNLLHKKDLSRLKQVWYCAKEEAPIDRSEMVRGFDTGEGNYVVVEDDELKKIAPSTASTMEILQFVSNEEVDPIYFEQSYYVVPDDKSPKPYTLFVAALKKTGKDAIAQVAMHNREHVVLIRAVDDGLLLHTLYYQDELHSDNMSEVLTATFSSKELELATSLVDHLSAPFSADQFKDTYRENVERLIDQKRNGQKITTIRQTPKAPVVDIMEALKQSLKSAPKATTSARGGGSRTPTKKVGKRRTAA